MPSKFQRNKHAWIVVLLGLAVGLPSLFFGFPQPTHDGHIHEALCTEFISQFRGKDYYPRWLVNLDGGLGGPTFYFYPPLAYFSTAFLSVLFDNPSQSWRVLGASAALSMVLSGVFSYLWLSRLVSQRGACAGAICYMALPYHFAIDLHTRGAFAELWSFPWLPLILFFVHELTHERIRGFFGLTLSFTALILTHLPVTLIFSPIPLLSVLFTGPPPGRLRSMAWVLCAMIIGAGVSSTYLLPALLQQSDVSMESMRIGRAYYKEGFFFQNLTLTNFQVARDPFEIKLFWIVLCTAGIGICAWYLHRTLKPDQNKRAASFWAAVAVYSVLMMLPISIPVYEAFPKLQLIQFPWRFNVLLSLAVTPLVAFASANLIGELSFKRVTVVVCGGALLLQCMLFAAEPLRVTSFAVRTHLIDPHSDWRANSYNAFEYRPRWCKVDVNAVLGRVRDAYGQLVKAQSLDGKATLVNKEWKPRHLLFSVDALDTSRVQIRQFFFPEWRAYLNGIHVPVVPSEPDGLLEVVVPAGKHTLELRLLASKWERLGNVLSLAALGVLLIVGTCKARHDLRKRVAI